MRKLNAAGGKIMFTEFGNNKVITERATAHLKKVAEMLSKQAKAKAKAKDTFWVYLGKWKDNAELSKDPVDILDGTKYSDAMIAYICSSSYVNGLGIVGTEYSGLLYLLKLCLTGKVNLSKEKMGKADFMKCDQLLLDYERVIFYLNHFQHELLVKGSNNT